VLWRLEECSKKKESSAAGLLNTEEPLAHVSTSSAGEEEGVFHVVAVSALGAVYVWRCTPSTSKSGKRRVEGSLLARVGVEGVSKHGSSGEGVFAARLEAGNKGKPLTLPLPATLCPKAVAVINVLITNVDEAKWTIVLIFLISKIRD
jgi:hypothetical protein